MKIDELTEEQLDWLVAQKVDKHVTKADVIWCNYQPSKNWAQLGPLILAYKISLGNQDHLGVPRESEWYATDRNGAWGLANHPNISVMRCLVMKFYGNEIEEDLL
jgi:hypothetical protein